MKKRILYCTWLGTMHCALEQGVCRCVSIRSLEEVSSERNDIISNDKHLLGLPNQIP